MTITKEGLAGILVMWKLLLVSNRELTLQNIKTLIILQRRVK